MEASRTPAENEPNPARAARLANALLYDLTAHEAYLDGAPHLKHAALRELYGGLLIEVVDEARRHSSPPRALDLGAGEGSATLPLLELGASVTAVDLSRAQLDRLTARCSRYPGNLETRCEDVLESIRSLRESGKRFDVVVANSFLHHVPDYLGLIREAAALLTDHGQFFSFQDPLRYDSVGKGSRLFSELAYASWRIFKGDVLRGLARRFRRQRGVFLEDCAADNAEYHVVRSGVDHEAVGRLLVASGFECRIVKYFSTQVLLWQTVGQRAGIESTFAVLARRPA